MPKWGVGDWSTRRITSSSAGQRTLTSERSQELKRFPYNDFMDQEALLGSDSTRGADAARAPGLWTRAPRHHIPLAAAPQLPPVLLRADRLVHRLVDAVGGAHVAAVRPHRRPAVAVVDARRAGRTDAPPRDVGRRARRPVPEAASSSSPPRPRSSSTRSCSRCSSRSTSPTPFLVLALMVVSGVIQAIDLPARLAFVPDLVPKEDLINAVGLNSLLFNSARAVGPALAGLLFLLADARRSALPGTSPVTLGAVRVLRAQRGQFPRGAVRAAGDRGAGRSSRRGASGTGRRGTVSATCARTRRWVRWCC